MNKEVEVRAIIKNPKKAEEILKKVGKFRGEKKQIDKYYVPKDNDYFKLKQPIEYLRIRHEDQKHNIGYHYVNLDKRGQKLSTSEYETQIEKPAVMEEILQKVGLIYKVTVTKRRKFFEVGDFEVVLDHIKELGDFMEIESKKDFGGTKKTLKACFDLLKKLNIDYEEEQGLKGYPNLILKGK